MAILDFDAKRDRYAVYTGAQDDAPLTNPLGNLARVKWHADLNMIGADLKTVTVPNINPLTWTPKYDRVLVAHGKPFRPLVLGCVWLAGKPVPIQGSFLANGAFYRVVCDAANVRLQCEAFTVDDYTGPITVSARFDLYICNMGVNAAGAAVLPPDFAGVEATPNRLRAGKFDTNDRHFAVDADGSVGFYRGASVSVLRTANSLAMKQNVHGYAASLGVNFQAPAALTVRTTGK